MQIAKRFRLFLPIWIALAGFGDAQSPLQQSVQHDIGLEPDEHVVFVRSYGYLIEDGKTWRLLVAGRIWKGHGVWLGGASASWLRATLGKARMLFVKDVRGRQLAVDQGAQRGEGGGGLDLPLREGDAGRPAGRAGGRGAEGGVRRAAHEGVGVGPLGVDHVLHNRTTR